jgi:ABC-type transport system involved in cytochrome c biogenesis permease subunit
MSNLVPIVLFLSVTAAIIYFLYVRHKERALLIEKGMAEFKPDVGKLNVMVNLKYGILLISVALGAMFGLILGKYINFYNPPIMFFSSIFLFTGLGLLLYYFIASKKENSDI